MSEFPEDRANLIEAIKIILEQAPNGIAMRLASRDQGLYGFMLSDVELSDGTDLSDIDQDTVTALQGLTSDCLAGVGWRGLVHEDKRGYGRVSFNLAY